MNGHQEDRLQDSSLTALGERATQNGHQQEILNGTGSNLIPIAKDNWPKRAFMDDTAIKWRHGKAPDYSLVDGVFMLERTHHHKPGSLEETVENLVKTWEMEMTHKTDPKQWETIDHSTYKLVVNGQHTYDIDDVSKLGTYNMVLVGSPFYNRDEHTFESSHTLFKEAFKGVFCWEVLNVLSGPPTVTFTWRHWGHWDGFYKETPPTNELIENHGLCIAKVNDQLKIQHLEIYFDPNQLLAPFMKHQNPLKGKCPLIHHD